MNILIDAFGGDNAPLDVIIGSIKAVEELKIDVTLVGDKSKIESCAKDNGISLSNLKILHAPSVFDIHEEPTTLLKQHSDSSMAVGLQALHDGKGDAFVSAGSTGALLVGATFIVKRLKGIKRAALAPVLPTAESPFMLLDAGANNDCRPEMLLQFAIMGSAYMQCVMGIKNPKVMLLNVGAEETKGRELELETYGLLEKSKLNFCGNIEARELPQGKADVVVTDGFTGNVALKLYEGMGKFLGHQLKHNIFSGSGKIAALLVLPRIKKLTCKMDYKTVGGAMMMGVQAPVVKAHGSSDATAFFNAIRQAKNCVDGNMIDEISLSLAK
ncbi:MAG: phosphate acyltransferase PlsX [Ruminococcus sp.]|nr:phosphate acyltransferase PlsX [Ruminococcus sp.]